MAGQGVNPSSVRLDGQWRQAGSTVGGHTADKMLQV